MQEPGSPGVRSSVNNSPVKTGTGKEMAQVFKRTSENGNVPFAAAQRGQRDLDARFRKDSLAKSAFVWKVPTSMQ